MSKDKILVAYDVDYNTYYDTKEFNVIVVFKKTPDRMILLKEKIFRFESKDLEVRKREFDKYLSEMTRGYDNVKILTS